MNRRELVAGVGSVGVLGGAGAVLLRGGFGSRSGSDSETNDEPSGPLTVDAIDAPGSRDESIRVPPEGADAALVSVFSTNCDPCEEEVANAADARERLRDEYGDAVRFLSVTIHPPGTVPENEVRDWWAEYGGEWPVAYDPEARFRERYGVPGPTSSVAIDGDGESRWIDTGPNRTDTMVEQVESILGTADDTGE